MFENLINDLKKGEKFVVMLAPSFVIDFKYPDIIVKLRKMGFSKVVELTFGARLVNRCYHKHISKNGKDIYISTTCPGIVNVIKAKYPNLIKNLIPFDSPMLAMAKIVKKHFPDHKAVFISPCTLKRYESKNSRNIKYVLTFKELKELVDYYEKNNLMKKGKFSGKFNKFYNDYTKIYPLSGGLSKTMHVKDILGENQVIVKEGTKEIIPVLDKCCKIKDKLFLDLLLCEGGCIGGSNVNSKQPIKTRHNKVMKYMKDSKKEKIGESKGKIVSAKGINFRRNY
ncbi:hypothetical protein K8R47_04125 [archaeon]|nr:hypothetical protein [archaeon]